MHYFYRWWLRRVVAKRLTEQERWQRSKQVLLDNMVHLAERGEPEDLACIREARKVLDQIVRPHLAH